MGDPVRNNSGIPNRPASGRSSARLSSSKGNSNGKSHSITKADANRTRQPRRSGPVSVPHFLLNRESGIRARPSNDLGSRFSGVGHDNFASMAILANCDVRKLQGYDNRIAGLLDRLGQEYPERWHAISMSLPHPSERRSPILKEANFHAGNIIDCLGTALVLDKKAKTYFKELLSRECTVRFISDQLKKNVTPPPYKHMERGHNLDTGAFAPDASREVLLSCLRLAKRASLHAKIEPAGARRFQEVLIDSLITLYDTGDFHKSYLVFHSGVKMSWPDLPGRHEADRTKATSLASERADNAVKFMGANTSGFRAFEDIKDRIYIKSFAKDIIYYFFLSAYRSTENYVIGTSIELLFGSTGLRPST